MTDINEDDQARHDEPPPRGRQAARVSQIPWRGWIDVLARVRQEVRSDNLDIVAAGVTFYAALALGPAFVALVSFYGLFASPSDVETLLEPVFALVPAGGGRGVIQALLQRAMAIAPASLTLRAVGAIVLSLWSANRGMKALITAVSLAYNEPPRRGVIAANLLSLGFAVVVTLVLALTSIAVIALPHLLAGARVGDSLGWLLTVLRWPVLFAVVVLGLAALYHWAPNRRPPRWRWVSVGAVVATLCWLLFSAAFSLYSRHTGDVRTGLEALDNVIALLVWLYVSAWAILLGAELNAELEHQTSCDSTIGPARPLGQRGAYVADHIGEARG
ncbi:Ribonuclease BN [Enhygromyxa salina]|uniref:Ribonuclease BN n=1 Tax=Enhygromyxa salina TaxID=215803 RepID=A0A0C1ZS55_9BACT|nr:YihY/virulence factor BrkB family protein [Enhygromyxa salina]KIG13908.1 Ribonuclease BN [Enhygromyxa salina]